MKLSKERPAGVTSPVGAERRVPTWAAGLLAGLARELPSVVTREDIAQRLEEVGSDRDVDRTVSELRRLGWLATLRVHGAWAFVPPGQEEVVDPYIDLRAWRARTSGLVFRLAGEAAAWHLGYLDRAPDGPVPIWLPSTQRLPDGLRRVVSLIRLKWPADLDSKLGPTPSLLRRRQLDLVTWAGGLPGFGAEALVVQLAARPGSFGPWADLVSHLAELANDCDTRRLTELLATHTASAWQRAAYLLHAGGRPQEGLDVLDRRPHHEMPTVLFDRGEDDADGVEDSRGLWVPQYRVVDRLLAPLQGLISKG
jgi:hypothetical protein